MSVAVVVFMAVPVLALINTSTESSSADIVVQIQDTDSFGGGGFDGSDGRLDADIDEDAENFIPGLDKGIGFPLDEEGAPLVVDRGTIREQLTGTGGNAAAAAAAQEAPGVRPRFYAGSGGSRGGSGSIGGGGGGGSPFAATQSGGGISVPGGNSDRAIRASVPRAVTNEFAFLNDHCVDGSHDEVIQAALEAKMDERVVVTSGR
ncbi:MAG: hypothetical protein AAFV62_06945 [Pseudomonadota bacterium]